jgi:hypothetical protein
MGEQIAARESIYNDQADGAYLEIDNNLPINDIIVCLHSFIADNLIFVHNASFGYNRCKFNFTLEAALMFTGKNINGEIPHDC